MIPPNAKARVLLNPKFGVKVEYRNIVFDTLQYIPPKRVVKSHKPESPPRPIPDNHYFKYGQALVPKLTFTETDTEILEMLADVFLKKYA